VGRRLTDRTPTITEQSNSIESAISAELRAESRTTAKAFVKVFAKVMSAVAMLSHKLVEHVARQLFVATAQDKDNNFLGSTINPLTAWSELVGVTRMDATAARLTVTVKAQQIGATLPSGQQLINTRTGVIYVPISNTVLSASDTLVDIIAISDRSGGDGSGLVGNMEVGETLDFANPLSAVQRTATVSSILETAVEAETSDSLRQRTATRYTQRPAGGSLADYRIWSREVATVDGAFPYTGLPGVVDLYISTNTDDRIPSQSVLDAVLASVQYDVSGLASRRPLHAFVNVLPVTVVDLTVTVNGLESQDESGLQTAINDALDQYFATLKPYIEGLDVAPRYDTASLVEISAIINTVCKARDSSFFNASLTDSATNTALLEYVLNTGQVATATVIYV